jgi:hypothetical protein
MERFYALFRPIPPLCPDPPKSILLWPRADASVSSATDEVAEMSGRVALTERFAKAATTEGRKSPILYDDAVIGFGFQVRDDGRKTLTLDYTFEGRRRRYLIGDYPA